MTGMLGLLSVPYREAATRYTHTRLRGACEFGASVPEWPQEHIQLSSGLFIGECETISLDNLLLIREVTNQSLIKSGSCWPGSVVLRLPLQASGNAWTGGHRIDAPCGFLLSGAKLPEIITPTALDLVSVVTVEIDTEAKKQKLLAGNAEDLSRKRVEWQQLQV
jgi:AraC family ethanolamine operon transcriptional activator